MDIPQQAMGLHFVPHRPRHQLQLDPAAGASHPGGNFPSAGRVQGIPVTPNGLGKSPQGPHHTKSCWFWELHHIQPGWQFSQVEAMIGLEEGNGIPELPLENGNPWYRFVRFSGVLD